MFVNYNLCCTVVTIALTDVISFIYYYFHFANIALSGLSSPRSKASTRRVSTDPAGSSVIHSYSVSSTYIFIYMS